MVKKKSIILTSALAGTLVAAPAMLMGTAFAADNFVAPADLAANQTVTITGIPTENQSAHTFKLYKLGTYSFANTDGTTLKSFSVETNPTYAELIKTAAGNTDANPLETLLASGESSGGADTGYTGGVRTFVDALVTGGLADMTADATITTTAGQATATASVPAGIYVAIDSSTADAGAIPAMFGTTVGGATAVNGETLGTFVYKMNTPEPPVKYVIDDDNNNAEVTDDTAVSFSTADTITFKLTQTVPYTTSFDSFTLKLIDELPAGLDYVATTSVKVNNTAYTDYTLTQDAGTGTKGLTYAFTKVKDMTPGQTIEVVYTAKMNNTVAMETDIPNTVTTSYNHNPNDLTSFTTTPGDTVKVKTHDLELKKVDMGGRSVDGAEFQLKEVKNGTAGAALAFDTNGFLVSTGGNTKITAGDVTLKGLDAGTYELTETKAPANYSGSFLPTVTFTIGEDGTVTETGGDANNLVEAANGAVTVKNARSILEMPATGAVGVARTLTVALVAFGAGGGLIYGARRKREAKATA